MPFEVKEPRFKPKEPKYLSKIGQRLLTAEQIEVALRLIGADIDDQFYAAGHDEDHVYSGLCELTDISFAELAGTGALSPVRGTRIRQATDVAVAIMRI